MRYAMVVTAPGGVENFRRIDWELPQPGPGQVVLRQTAIGLNYIDVYFRTGLYPWDVPANLIPGGEAAGVIEAVGPGVDLPVGQRVAYTVRNGAYASHRVIAASDLVPIPEGISDEIAAAVMLKGLTVHYLIHHSYPVTAGDCVLVHAAAGGVGLLAGQWLKHKGVRAIGTAGTPEKCALALAHGYDAVIDYKTTDFVAETMRLTDGKGVKAVYDSVGAVTVKKSIEVLETFGTLVSFGQSSGPALDFRISDLARGSLRLTRPTLFHHTAQPGWLRQASREIFDLIADGTIRVEIGQRYDLKDVAAAHTALESRKTTGCTILIP